MIKNQLIFLVATSLLLIGCRRQPILPPLLPTPATPPATMVVTPTAAPTPTPAALPTAEPTEPQPIPPGTAANPFSGTFEGILNGDEGSSAPVTLTLEQDGPSVSGTITVGEGLLIDGGNCGATTVPAGTQSASGEVDTTTPNHLDAEATFTVQSFTITLDLDADLSEDGQALTAEATIDLPFLCGRDPVITGTFTRI